MDKCHRPPHTATTSCFTFARKQPCRLLVIAARLQCYQSVERAFNPLVDRPASVPKRYTCCCTPRDRAREHQRTNSSSPLQRGSTSIIPAYAGSPQPVLFHPLFATVAQQYQNRAPIQLDLPECRGTCELDIIAAGWDVDCFEWKLPYHLMERENYWMWYNARVYDKDESLYEGPPAFSAAFSVATYYWFDNNVAELFDTFRINTTVMYKATEGARGNMHWRNCTLTEALIRYPVEISNGTLTMKALAQKTNSTVHKVQRQRETNGQGSKSSYCDI